MRAVWKGNRSMTCTLMDAKEKKLQKKELPTIRIELMTLSWPRTATSDTLYH